MSKPHDALARSLTKELEHVENQNEEFFEAFGARDIKRMAKVWSHSPHARCVHPGWELVVGWTDIRESWLEIFKTIQEIDFVLEDVHVEVSGTTAWVNLIAFVDVTTEEGDVFSASVAVTNIFERSGDDWLMVLHHSSNFSDDVVEEEEPEFTIGGRRTSGIDDPN